VEAGAKAKDEFQRFLCNLSCRQNQFSDHHVLLSWAIFIGSASSNIILPSQRIGLLQPHFAGFGNELADFVRLLVERLFSETGNNEEILECMNI